MLNFFSLSLARVDDDKKKYKTRFFPLVLAHTKLSSECRDRRRKKKNNCKAFYCFSSLNYLTRCGHLEMGGLSFIQSNKLMVERLITGERKFIKWVKTIIKLIEKLNCQLFVLSQKNVEFIAANRI